MSQLAYLLLVGVASWGLYRLFKPSCNIDIDVRSEEVAVRGSVAAAKQGAIRAFFHQDLPEVTQVRVQGHWDGKRLTLRFHGPISPGHRQRIRNFLITTL